jgi:hypothetical protein
MRNHILRLIRADVMLRDVLNIRVIPVKSSHI